MIMKKYKYLLLRRSIQIMIMGLFVAGNAYGWMIFRGNLSAAKVFEFIPLADPFAVLQSFAAGSALAADVIIGAALIVLVYAILGGRIFCSWVCPMNMVTDLANRIRKHFHKPGEERPWKISKGIRYWILALSVVLSLLLGVAAFEWVSPIGVLHRGIIYGMGAGWFFVLVVFLFDLLAVKNGFCGHLCPLGGFYSLTGRFGFLRIGYDREKCTMCMKCIDICPEKQVLSLVGQYSGAVLSGECTNCGRCIDVCDDSAVNFSSIYAKHRVQ
jgi:ferredoxin-type protein NapH